MRVGVPPLGTLLDRDPLDEADPPPQGPVSRFFAEQPIEAVFNAKRGGLLPRKILDALDSSDARLGRDDVQRAFGRFAYDIDRAAGVGGRPSIDLARDATLVPATHGPRITLLTFRGPKHGRPVYGFRAKTLFERLALEVHDLYLHRPKLARCVFCNSIFVPRNNELNCRWALWDANSHAALAQCATNEATEHWNATHKGAASMFGSEKDRERERKRIDQRVHRAQQRAGSDFNDPAVQEALAERDAFQDHFAKKRGPKGHSAAPEVELLPDHELGTPESRGESQPRQ
jgi:hypothetical protein